MTEKKDIEFTFLLKEKMGIPETFAFQRNYVTANHIRSQTMNSISPSSPSSIVTLRVEEGIASDPDERETERHSEIPDSSTTIHDHSYRNTVNSKYLSLEGMQWNVSSPQRSPSSSFDRL